MDAFNGLTMAGNIPSADEALLNAYRDFLAATKANPQRARAWMCKGISNVYQQNFQDAVDDFSKTLELKPGEPMAHFNRAEARFELGQYKDAIEDYNAVLDSKSGDLDALTGRGHCYYLLSDFEKAMADFNIVVQLAPKSATAFVNRGETYQMMGEWASAYQDFSKSIELEPTSAGLLKMAWMLANSPQKDFMRPDESLQLCRQAEEVAGMSLQLMKTKVAAELAAGNQEVAKALESKLAELSDTNDTQQKIRLAAFAKTRDEIDAETGKRPADVQTAVLEEDVDQ